MDNNYGRNFGKLQENFLWREYFIGIVFTHYSLLFRIYLLKRIDSFESINIFSKKNIEFILRIQRISISWI